MRHDFAVIVLGLGAVGSAAAYQLARRGVRVVGFDQFSPPHARGSSHGQTRITRLAIGEGAHYTPLAVRSHEIWREIERDTQRDLLTLTGAVIVSSRSRSSDAHVANFFTNTVAAAERHGIAHEILTAAEIRRRFPPLDVRDDEYGYYEPTGGFLRPEACIDAQLQLAATHGAQLHRDERVVAFEQDSGGVHVRTVRGLYHADRLVVAAGAWLPLLVDPTTARCFRVTRQVSCWFAPIGPIAPFLPERFPVFIWEPQGVGEALYGFPALDAQSRGVKIAGAGYGSETTAAAVHRAVESEEIAQVHARIVAPCLPTLSNRCVRATACLYTVTPDAGFVVDWLPEGGHVIVASPCSGHGFKHSAAIGELVADLALEGRSRFDLTPMRMGRFD